MNWTANDDPSQAHEVLVTLLENPNKMILDSAASKSVAGEEWMKNFLDLLEKDTRHHM